MPTYRKKKGKDAWHWCRNCENDPKTDYDEKKLYGKERPSTGELCNQCGAKEKRNDCKL